MNRLGLILLLFILLCLPRPAAGQVGQTGQEVLPINHFSVSFLPASDAGSNPPTPVHLRLTPDADLTWLPPPATEADQGAPRQRAFEYSDGYRLRARIHRYASLATLPLFGAEAIVGQSLYNNPSDSKKSIHLALATGMGTLFAVNSVTGVWNLIEARKDPNGRTRRFIHGVLLLAADAGFLAAAMTAPDEEEGGIRNAASLSHSRNRHRTLALTSIGLSTIGYLVMLIGR